MSVKEIAMRMTLKALVHVTEVFRNEEGQAEICRILSETNEA